MNKRVLLACISVVTLYSTVSPFRGFFVTGYHMKPVLVVLAAGMGSRYGGLKQVDTFGPHREGIIDYAIYDALQAGFGSVICVIRSSFEKEFAEKISDKRKDMIDITHVYQPLSPSQILGIPVIDREKPRGPTHALLCAKEYIDRPFAVINADDFYGADAYKQMYIFLTTRVSPTICSMVSYVLENTLSDHGEVNRGVCQISLNNTLHEVHEHYKIRRREGDIIIDKDGKKLPPSTPVSMNFWGFHQAHLTPIEELFTEFLHKHGQELTSEWVIPDLVDKLIHARGVLCEVMQSHDQWYGVTHREDKDHVSEILHALVNEKKYPSPIV